MAKLLDMHDYNITAIQVDNDGNVQLCLLGDKQKLLLFYDVIRMKINNFQMGNILLEINIYDDFLNKEYLYDLLCFLYDINDDELGNDWIRSIITKLNDRSLILIELVESYGAYGVIICHSYAEKVFHSCKTI
jgi:hypothetical protein